MFSKMCDFIRTKAIGLTARVNTFKKHPTYDSRADLKIAMHELDGMFNLALAMNKYNPLGNDLREQVTYAREAVESLYGKPGRRKEKIIYTRINSQKTKQ